MSRCAKVASSRRRVKSIGRRLAIPRGMLVGLRLGEGPQCGHSAAMGVSRWSERNRRFSGTFRWERLAGAPGTTGGTAHRPHVLGTQRVAGNAPLSARDLFDSYPSDGAHGFAFDADHRVGKLLDDLLLLCRPEYTLNQLHLLQLVAGFIDPYVARRYELRLLPTLARRVDRPPGLGAPRKVTPRPLEALSREPLNTH